MDRKSNSIKLLLVDDEEEFLMSSSQALSRRGFEVDIALNGVTALEMIEQSNYDLVVLDVKMPDIDGIEVFRQINKKIPDLPVILLTGHSSFQDAFQTSKNGIADYISKPVDMEELAERIREAVNKAKSYVEKNDQDPDLLEFDEIIRIMLIDDEVDFLDSMKRVLERRRMEVITADNGKLALTLLKECIIDVVILDVKMPGMDGLEVLRHIKNDFPYTEVILLTGHPSVEAALEGIKLGANEYMKKPPKIDELVATIRKLFYNKQKYIQEQQKRLIEDVKRRYPD
jgi:DNA-binding NtrC family response regulator